jgi:hypothetical protein
MENKKIKMDEEKQGKTDIENQRFSNHRPKRGFKTRENETNERGKSLNIFSDL